jgi:ectoine hydroxylase-related dioxygenase (phytanoyl-CoA dioxygenase family)
MNKKLTVKPLTDKQLKQLKEDGYVMLGRIMGDDTLKAIRAEEARFRKTPLKRDSDHPDARTIFRSQVCNYSAPVRDYAIHGEHIPLLPSLVGSPNVLFWYIQFVTKYPDADTGKSEFPWHQDDGYGHVEPRPAVTIWVALDDVDEQNGCVWVFPGSHKQGPVPHNKISADSWYMDVKVEGDGVPAILKAGEAVAFWGLTLHRSKLNHTNKPRRGFFMGYADASSRFGPDQEALLDWPDSWMACGQIVPPEGKIAAKIVQADA